jgi:hypothetical protein
VDSTPRTTEQRLWNWGDWCNSDGRARHRCGSAEGRYVAPKWESQTSSSSGSGIDAKDAERVEGVIVRIRDQIWRRFLKMRYVDRQRPTDWVFRRNFGDEEAVRRLHAELVSVIERELAVMHEQETRRGLRGQRFT